MDGMQAWHGIDGGMNERMVGYQKEGEGMDDGWVTLQCVPLQCITLQRIAVSALLYSALQSVHYFDSQ